jgi:UDP-GlcNAc3NAcA epimerase
MPEEVNRIVTDRVSRFLFAPTETAMRNLEREGMKESAYLVGDVMYDALIMNEPLIERYSSVLARLKVQSKGFYLATVHRASNTNRAQHLSSILRGLQQLDRPVVFPVHPRTRHKMESHGIEAATLSNVQFIEPVGYFEMLALLTHARKIVTDSGGVQKEAYFLQTPCVTLREETEWVETLEGGWNQLVGVNEEAIVRASTSDLPTVSQKKPYGDGDASLRIADTLKENI